MCFESFVSLQEFIESFKGKNERMIHIDYSYLVSSKASSIYILHLQVSIVSQQLDSSLCSLSDVLNPLKHLMLALNARPFFMQSSCS